MLKNLDRLKSFYHVFLLGNVGKAADALHVTQPAVTQALQKLEEETLTPLFIRQHKKLVPTSAGERLFDVVQPFMDELDVCLKNLAHAQDEPFGELRIGAPAEYGKVYLPGIMAEFRKQYPGVTFSLQFAHAEEILPLVKNGKLDLALVDLFLVNERLAENTSLYHFEPLVHEEVALACSKQYYAENVRNDNSLEALSALDFIEYSLNIQTVENWFKHHFGTPKLSLRTVITVDSHDAVISTIKHHTGLGIISTHLVKNEIRNGDIVTIKSAKKDIVNQISLVELQDKIPTLTEKAFKKFLIEKMQNFGL